MTARSDAVASESHVAQAARDGLSFGNAVDAVVAGVLVAAAESPSVFSGHFKCWSQGPGREYVRSTDACASLGWACHGRAACSRASECRPRRASVCRRSPRQLHGRSDRSAARRSFASGARRSTAREHVHRARARTGDVLPAWSGRADRRLRGKRTDRGSGAVCGRHADPRRSSSVRPVIVSQDDRALDPSGVLLVPWRGDAAHDASFTQVVAAGDARGLVAIACYEAPMDGLDVPALGLVAPAFAVPVMRHEPRARPGEPCRAAAPIALRAHHGLADLAVGIAQAADAEASLDAVIGILLNAITISAALAEARSGRTVALVRSGDSVKALSSA